METKNKRKRKWTGNTNLELTDRGNKEQAKEEMDRKHQPRVDRQRKQRTSERGNGQETPT